MPFMKKEQCDGTFYEIDTSQGAWFVPDDVTGDLGIPIGETIVAPNDDDAESEAWNSLVERVEDYIEGGDIHSIACYSGSLYRLSAPGYMDCTDWTTDPDSPEFDDDEPDDDEPDDDESDNA